MKTVPFSDAILALENFNVAANKRYKQGMEQPPKIEISICFKLKNIYGLKSK